ncbi:MAG: shikimate dehydrogenase [Pseudomonadota bacterium]
MTKRITAGLIGSHIGRSRLARGLEVLCNHHGLELAFEPIDSAVLPAFDFAACVESLRAKGWTGVTVTHPQKPQAAAFAGAHMAPDVAHLGASNTLIFRPLSGHNTDYSGFLAAWRARMGSAPGRVAMAGAGGVARALGPAFATLGARDIALWDEDPDRATDLASRIGPPARAIPPQEIAEAVALADGLVNATPLGMGADARSAFQLSHLGPQSWAFDAVYTPVWTPFLGAARQAGLTCLTGFDLFTFMALDSFSLYAELPADPSLARLLVPLEPKEPVHA